MINVEKICCQKIRVEEVISGVLEGPKEVNFKYGKFDISLIQGGIRNIEISSKESCPLKEFIDTLLDIEKFNYLFEGSFLTLNEISAYNNSGEQIANRNDLKQWLETNRCDFFKSKAVDQALINERFICPFVYIENCFDKWLKLENELGIIYTAVVYNASSYFPSDLKLAYLIEVCESLCRFLSNKDKFFGLSTSKDDKITLRTYIDAIISRYGKIIFKKEYDEGRDEFLKKLVGTRNYIMHIKQGSNKHLDGENSLFYSIKFVTMYRLAFIQLLGIDISNFENSIEKLTSIIDERLEKAVADT